MIKYFEEIEDTRQQWKIKYLLVEVIVMTIIAVTAGADNWGEIAMYCKGKITMFQEKFGLKLENGVPTDDTFQRIFAIIKPEQLEKCFRNWVQSVFTIEKNEIISLDGEQAELLMKNNREYQIANEIGDLYKVGAIGNNCRQEARDMVFAAMVYV